MKQTKEVALTLPASIWDVARLLPGRTPTYRTARGAAYLGDAADLLARMPDGSVDLVVTSPPYALEFKKEYGNAAKADYVGWFRPFGEQIRRVLTDAGSFVLNIGGSYNQGSPTRSLYHFKVLLMLCEDVGFRLARECFWHNPAKLPAPAEWVNVRRQRVKDAVEYVWWLSKTDWPKADNRRVLSEYSADMRRLMKRGYIAKTRPSGHVITSKFRRDHGGSIPSNLIGGEVDDRIVEDPVASNLIEKGNNESNSDYIRSCASMGFKPHPARFPRALPDFFIRFLTDKDDVVLDPFAGSNMTGSVAEQLGRRWISMEIDSGYVEASKVRFAGLLEGSSENVRTA